MTLMASRFGFPTPRHERVAELACEFFAGLAQVDTVLVVNSCARGQATPDSDIDLAVLIDASKAAASPRATEDLEAAWLAFTTDHLVVREFRQSGRFALVHLDVFDGRFRPTVWDEGGGPDTFEIEIGNRVAHAVPIGPTGPCFRELQSRWMPYYEDDLRERRLAMARDACAYDLEHVAFFVSRGLHFQAFDRLYKAFQEFLQALFISRRFYPVAYNKWIREQVENWLGLPDLYRELPPIISVGNIESAELVDRAAALRTLLDHWVQ